MYVLDSFAEIGNGWQEIRDSILGILLGSTVFSKSTNSQLSVAVAHLALQCEEWNHCLLHLKSFVNPSSSARTALVVMQILQYIPEDIECVSFDFFGPIYSSKFSQIRLYMILTIITLAKLVY